MSEGRIYDDIWPLNVAGRYCSDMTSLVKDKLDAIYPEGWEANSHMLLMTHEGYPYQGTWHHDGSSEYPDDSIVLICLSGQDDIEGPVKYSLYPSERVIFPASQPHRGCCLSYRVTYHCRVGPKGKVMPESPKDVLPPMTLRRFLGRTWRTIKYYVRQGL